jgi:hypothetical protein
VPALDLDLAADPAATARTKQGIARILDLPWTV